MIAPPRLVVIVVAAQLAVAASLAFAAAPPARTTQPASPRGPASNADAAPAVESSLAEPAPTELDLTGKWLLRHVVRRSERASYRGLVLLYRVDLVQQGTRVTGTATKWRDNGRDVAPSARGTLQIDGTVDGDEIVGRFVETSNGRHSRGTFRWRYSLREGWLEGSFNTGVASASGEAIAVAIG